VRKHCKVIYRGVSRKNREVLTFLRPLSFSRRYLGRKGEERKRHDAPTITARHRHPWLSDGRMNGWADMPRSDGLPKGWLYYARRFSAHPGVNRSKIAPAVMILRRVGCGTKEAVKNCGVCPDGLRYSVYSENRFICQYIQNLI